MDIFTEDEHFSPLKPLKRIQAMPRRTGEDIPMDPMAVMGSVGSVGSVWSAGSAAMLGATIVSSEKMGSIWQVGDAWWPKT